MTDEEILASVEKRILLATGLNFSLAQKNKILNLLNFYAEEEKLSLEEFSNSFNSRSKYFQKLINEITINETYFFRERIQFEYLKEHIFPKFAGRKMNIWSAACSTGEEAVSLLALALSCGVDASVYATDIDENAINTLRKGIYSQYSFRKDGDEFHKLLLPYCRKDGESYIFDKSFINRIHSSLLNLNSEEYYPFPVQMDLVFIRNVYIYFDMETRLKISKKIAGTMAENGCLFFSINEIGSFRKELEEFDLHKTHEGSLYYFVKSFVAKKTTDSSFVEKSNLNIDLKSYTKNPRRLAATEEYKNLIERKSSDYKFETSVENSASEKIVRLSEKEYFEKICALINESKFEEALTDAENLKQNFKEFYINFFKGYIEYYADNKVSAHKYFELSIKAKENFWPSYFYIGLLQKDIGEYEKAEITLEKCYRLLEENSGAEDEYGFVLGEIDKFYVKKICESVLKLQGSN